MKWRVSLAVLFGCLSVATLCTEPQQPKREFQLQANSADLWTLFERESKLSTVAAGFGFHGRPRVGSRRLRSCQGRSR